VKVLTGQWRNFYRSHLLGSVFFICFSPQIWAQAEPNLTEFSRLAQQGQWQQAYQLATQLELDFAGEAEFDFAYGKVALQVGQNDVAVFALERVLAARPEWEQARFSLAQAYYLTGNYPAAQELLNYAYQQQDISSQLDAMKRQLQQAENAGKSYLKQRIRYALGYDSNVNSGTTEDRIYIPSLGDIAVFPGSQASEDMVQQLGYSLDGRWQLNQQYAVLADFNLSASKFQDLSQYDRQSAAMRLGWSAEFEDFQYQARLYSRPLRLDGQMYRHDYGVQWNGRYRWTAKHSLFGQLSSGRSDNRLDERLALTANAASVGWEYRAGSWLSRLEVNYQDEQSRLDSANYNSRSVRGAAASLMYPLSDSQLLMLRADVQSIDYAAEHPLFKQDRQETLRSVGASWYWQLTTKLTSELRCSYSNKSGSINLYQYDRTECLVGASYAF